MPVGRRPVGDRLRILILTPYLPYPPQQGFALRVHHIVRELSRRHDVTLLSYESPDRPAAAAAYAAMGVATRTVARPVRGHAGLRKLRALFSRHSYRWRERYNPAMQAAIDEVLAATSFDVVQFEAEEFSRYRYPPTVAVCFDAHNIWYELRMRMLALDRSMLRRLYKRLDAVKSRREERIAWRSASACLMTSRREAEVATRSGAARTVVVPNGVDIDYLRPLDAAPEPETIVFTGVIAYGPNADGIRWFVREVLPLIRDERPRARLLIVGRSVPHDIEALDGGAIEVTGLVPDVRPYIGRASVAIAPLRAGSGTRIKILEAMAMGRPVVTTSIGCDGLDVVDGQHVLVADDAPGLASAVVRVLADEELAAAMGSAGRALVELEYDWSMIVARLEAVYREVLAATGLVG